MAKITAINHKHFEGIVYNLEVEEDNTYIAEGVIVHNCEIPVNSMSKFDVLYSPSKVSI